MDKAEKIRTRVMALVLIRRVLLALLASSAGILGLRLLQKFSGLFLPAWTSACALGPVVLALLWPARVRWVRVGERLGLGGKLAALEAVRQTPDHPFLPLLLPQIALRPWRLFVPEAFALLPILILAGLLAFPTRISEQINLAREPTYSVVAEEASQKSPKDSPDVRPRTPSAPELPQLPASFSYAGSPYAELFSRLFGEQVSPEEVLERLRTEEGLLRQIAELLSQAASQGISPELLGEIVEVAAELGRPDLGSALFSALEKGDVQEAEEVVAAAMEGLSAAKEQVSAPSPSGETTSTPGTKEAGPGGAENGPLGSVSGEIVMDVENHILMEEHWTSAGEGQTPLGERREKAEEEGMSLGPGWEEGEPVSLAPPLSPPELEEIARVPVQPGEGPVRQRFVLALPGETPESAPPPSGTAFTAEAELILSGRDLPPELRDLVRRYFQILTEGGNP